MSIPGQLDCTVPPPLPPPTFIDGLDDGIDLGWQYQNTESLKKFHLAPIKSGSSLLTKSSRSSQLHKDEDEDIAMDLDGEDAYARPSPRTRQSIPLQPRRQSQRSDLQEEPLPGHTDSRYDTERPLAQQSHRWSNHAYDQHLLQKIGKPHSPPRQQQSPISGRDSSGSGMSFRPHQSMSQARPVLDSPIPAGLSTRALPSPGSAVPNSPRDSWRDDLALNSFDRSALTLPSPSEAGYFSRSGQDTVPDSRTRSERGSYDSAAFTDMESINEDAESTTSYSISERPQPFTHHGPKRRAVSPLTGSGQTPRIPKQELKLGPTLPSLATQQLPQPQSAGSLLSSASSSMTFPSYASSARMSHASSVTSAASSESYVKRQLQTPTITDSPTSMLAPPRRTSASEDKEQEKKSPKSHVEIQARPTRIGSYFMCGCCPKKPKRFDSEQQLRLHENEKQYTCAFCSNRFKNKNEAERHQNSLHVRNQSWSCAAISTYQAAFYPSSIVNPRSTSSDTCGFCGQEFSNPVNWEERAEHLTNEHKFGECNASKKFFRADHFRQHLKHSHAGKSGKWTNILENQCQRDEAAEAGSVDHYAVAATPGQQRLGAENPSPGGADI